MSRLLHIPEPGQLVDVRRRRYVVVDIAQSTLPPDIFASSLSQGQHLVTLSSVEDDALGEELSVIWEIEPGATTIEKTPLPPPIGFDTPQRPDTFLNAVRPWIGYRKITRNATSGFCPLWREAVTLQEGTYLFSTLHGTRPVVPLPQCITASKSTLTAHFFFCPVSLAV